MTRPTYRLTPHEHISAADQYTDAVREAALQWVGRGELPSRNNRGPDVDALRDIAGVGRIGGDGAWCAVFASAAMQMAGGSRFTPPCKLSAGAGRLVRNLGKSGDYVIPVQLWGRWTRYTGRLSAREGNRALLWAWHRGKNERTKWQSHIEVGLSYDPETDTLTTVAGNVVPGVEARNDLLAVGIVPAPGQALVHVRRHRNGAWRKRLLAAAAV